MQPAKFLGEVAALGLAGFDPAPMVIGLAALAAGVSRRAVLAFAGTLLGGTALWLFVLSRFAGKLLAHIHWHRLLRENPVAAAVEGAVCLGLLGWGLARLRGRSVGERPETEKQRGGWELQLVALGFVAVVIGDPPFPIAAVLAGRAPWGYALLAGVIWAALSQFPLTLLALVLLTPHRRGVALIHSYWNRVAWLGRPLATAVLIGLGVIGLADAAAYALRGRFLLG